MLQNCYIYLLHTKPGRRLYWRSRPNSAKSGCCAPDVSWWKALLLVFCWQGAWEGAIGVFWFSVMRVWLRAVSDTLSWFPCTSQSNTRISLFHCCATMSCDANNEEQKMWRHGLHPVPTYLFLSSRLQVDLFASHCPLSAVSMTSSLVHSSSQKA